jgi:hypothetical protein
MDLTGGLSLTRARLTASRAPGGVARARLLDVYCKLLKLESEGAVREYLTEIFMQISVQEVAIKETKNVRSSELFAAFLLLWHAAPAAALRFLGRCCLYARARKQTPECRSR